MTSSQISLHLAASEQAGLKTLLKNLRESYPDQVRQVILFGSKARNDSHSDSDLDILVLVETETWALRYDIWKLAGRVEWEYDDLLFNIQVISLERWQAMTQAGFSLCQNVAREGIAL